MEKKVAVTFVLRDMNSEGIAGFYSLSSTAVPLDNFPPEIAAKLPKYPLVPATLLARLAIDSVYRGQGLGEFLLLHALEKSLDHSKVQMYPSDTIGYSTESCPPLIPAA